MNNEFKKRILSSLVLIPMSLFFIIKGSFFFNIFLLICFIVTFFEWYKMSKRKNYHVFGYFFLTLSFYAAYSLRNKFNDDGLLIFLFIITICISTDIGGYIFGKFFGGPKLIKISPNKTYSGMFGGYFLSIIFANILYFFYPILFNENTQELKITSLLIILSISSISQIGDIIVSYFKRLSKIKNTGNLIPGHGGLLDRIDGMIFAFPFSYLIFTFYIFK